MDLDVVDGSAHGQGPSVDLQNDFWALNPGHDPVSWTLVHVPKIT